LILSEELHDQPGVAFGRGISHLLEKGEQLVGPREHEGDGPDGGEDNNVLGSFADGSPEGIKPGSRYSTTIFIFLTPFYPPGHLCSSSNFSRNSVPSAEYMADEVPTPTTSTTSTTRALGVRKRVDSFEDDSFFLESHKRPRVSAMAFPSSYGRPNSIGMGVSSP